MGLKPWLFVVPETGEEMGVFLDRTDGGEKRGGVEAVPAYREYSHLKPRPPALLA